MTNQLIDILCCPVTHKELKRAGKDQIQAINKAIKAGKLCRHDGEAIREPIREALVTVDDRTLYRIDDGIPVLLEDEAIAMVQLEH